MANEITVGLTATCVNGNYRYTKSANQQFTQTTAGGGNPGVVAVATSATTISFTGMTGRGMAFIQNLGPTNYMELGADNTGTFVPCLRINVNEFCWVRFASGTIQLRANTAAVTAIVETLEN